MPGSALSLFMESSMTIHRNCLAFVAVVSLLGPAWGQAPRPVRVGVLGLDNYQAVAYAQLFNDPKASGDLAGVRVVAAYPASASPDIPESVDGLPKWKKQIAAFDVKLAHSVDELLRGCDAVMIMSLDGRKHLEQATAVLKAGKRLYIGRPLAASWADAVAIMKLAKESGTPCWTSSQHRFSPGFSGMRNHPEVGRVVGCDIYGGCPTEPSHAELYWHALHSIEALYAIMGSGCDTVRCASTPYAIAITGVWKDGRVGTYRGIKKGAVKYSATVFGDKGVSVAGIYGHGVPVKGIVPTNDRYMGYEGIAIEMAKFFKGGAVSVSAAETLEIFAFMEAAHESKRQNGAAVRISNILKKVQ
ncbi:MAG: gfo/Idh/MocA family oxidoreductase [Planctomycetes bacterium]|nr:gfo/Idh/MocA family oxidoreductase [Planctomycetota bacterium]